MLDQAAKDSPQNSNTRARKNQTGTSRNQPTHQPKFLWTDPWPKITVIQRLLFLFQYTKMITKLKSHKTSAVWQIVQDKILFPWTLTTNHPIEYTYQTRLYTRRGYHNNPILNPTQDGLPHVDKIPSWTSSGPPSWKSYKIRLLNLQNPLK